MLHLSLSHLPSIALTAATLLGAGIASEDAPLDAGKNSELHGAGAAGLAEPAPAAAALVRDPIDQRELDRVLREIKRDVERMRGRRFQRPVQARLLSAAAYAELARERLLGDEDEDDGEGRRRMHARETAARLLGLIPPGMDLVGTITEVMEASASGFYDDENDTVWLVEGLDSRTARLLLVYELTHALNDQLYGFHERLDELAHSEDETNALLAVAEGSANAALVEWLREHRDEYSTSVELPGLQTEAMRMAPEVVWMPSVCTVMRGTTFLLRTSREMDMFRGTPTRRDLQRAFVDPPSSTEQILHPEKYWNEERLDRPQRVGFSARELPDGWQVLHEDTLGELGMNLFTTPLAQRSGIDLANPTAPLRVRYTNAPARGWAGDRYVLLGHGAGRLLVSVSRWDSAEDTVEFYDALEGVRPNVLENTLQSCIEVAPRGSSPGCLSGTFASRDDRRLECLFASWYGVDERDVDEVIDTLSWGRTAGGPQATLDPEGD